MKRNLHLDFETYCELDLKKVGVYRYTEHSSFRILCAAWKMDGQSLQSAPGDEAWKQLRLRLNDPATQGHAWNAAFETAVLARFGVEPANPISCTMQRALSYGLPARLEQAAKALGRGVQKDMAGHRLMLRMSRPTRPDAPQWLPEDHAALMAYCEQDVEAEAGLAAVIPELQPEEAELAALDRLMNGSGDLRIDRERVLLLQAVARDAEAAEAARCTVLTCGAVTSPGTQTLRLREWLAAHGCTVQDLSRSEVEMALDKWGDELSPEVFEVLQIRLRAARASTRKLTRMLDMACNEDDALEGQFQFCGAGRTGRWSGRGVQVQNLPRVPKDFDPDLFCETADLDGLGTAMGLNAVAPAPLLDCISWSLRSCLIAAGGGPLWSFDFSQIEARVLAWLAGQNDVLEVFRSGEDAYVWAAQQFGSDNRQLGKVLILALGFGMGAVKLRETARKSYQVVMTAGEAEVFKTGWRLRNARIVNFWAEIEMAAKQAILNRGLVYAVGGSGVAFQSTARTLQMRLPSGRVLYYHRPGINCETGNIHYMGTDLGGTWAEQRTWGGKLAENATQATARDIMAEAMLRVWRRQGLVPVMTVHDELVYVPNGEQVADLADIIRESPQWAAALPIAGESKMMSRYGVVVNT